MSGTGRVGVLLRAQRGGLGVGVVEGTIFWNVAMLCNTRAPVTCAGSACAHAPMAPPASNVADRGTELTLGLVCACTCTGGLQTH